jgi:hypothetical protein
MSVYGHNSRAFDDWFDPEYFDDHESESLAEIEDEIEDEISTLNLITSGLLVSDDAQDIELWRSLRGIEIPMSLESSEWGDVER